MPLPLLPRIATQSLAYVERLTSHNATTAPSSKLRLTFSNRTMGDRSRHVEKSLGRIQRSAAQYLGRDVNVVIVAIKKSLRFVAERENHAPAVDYDIYGPDSSGAA